MQGEDDSVGANSEQVNGPSWGNVPERGAGVLSGDSACSEAQKTEWAWSDHSPDSFGSK